MGSLEQYIAKMLNISIEQAKSISTQVKDARLFNSATL